MEENVKFPLEVSENKGVILVYLEPMPYGGGDQLRSVSPVFVQTTNEEWFLTFKWLKKCKEK